MAEKNDTTGRWERTLDAAHDDAMKLVRRGGIRTMTVRVDLDAGSWSTYSVDYEAVAPMEKKTWEESIITGYDGELYERSLIIDLANTETVRSRLSGYERIVFRLGLEERSYSPDEVIAALDAIVASMEKGK